MLTLKPWALQAADRKTGQVIPTWKTAEAKMSVCINGAYVPFKNVPDSIPRFVRPALFSTGDENWELQFFGSSFLAKYRGLHFGIATAHQTSTAHGAPDASKYVVLKEVGGKTLAIPPSNLHIPSVENEGDSSLNDLIFFDFGTLEAQYRATHLDLTNILWSDDNSPADYSFLIGYPTNSAIITLNRDDYSALAGFTARWVRQDLQAAKPEALDTEHRNIFIKHDRSTRLSIDPDGLSGSPVFSIVKAATSERFIRFEGIITNARGDRFAVYPSVYIRDMLEHIVDRP